MTYFEFYGLKPGFNLDDSFLKKKFLEFSRLYHPDHFALSVGATQVEADEKSAFNNKAYKILANPDSRLKYLLELKDVIKDEEVYSLEQDFLMEMLDLNDLVTDDPAEAFVELNRIESNLYLSMKPVLESYDHDQLTESELTRIKDYHYKKRYILRIRENLNKFATE